MSRVGTGTVVNPQLPVHTLDYLRSTSSTLFSAVLTASAKFFRRQLYPDLLAHTQLAVNRATSLGTCNVGIIQALLIMLYWKAPRDGSLWVKMGIAIRLGYQLGLHIPRTKPLPEDVLEARIMADAERTWIVISCKQWRTRAWLTDEKALTDCTWLRVCNPLRQVFRRVWSPHDGAAGGGSRGGFEFERQCRCQCRRQRLRR